MRYYSLAAYLALLIILTGVIYPPPSAAQTADQSPLGVNLEAMQDWSDDLALLDFFKTSRE